MELWFRKVGQYKSSLYEIARGLLRSRDNQARRARELADELREQKERNAELDRQLAIQRRELDRKREQIRVLERSNDQLRNQGVVLPDDPPLPNHQYGPRLISLCMNLARRIGLRPSVEAIRIVWDFLGIEANVPHYASVRTWLCRLGVDGIGQSMEVHDDWIWLADHSVQVGEEKVLTILGIRASELPKPGETLQLENVHTLAVVPGKSWKREDVREQYKVLAKKVGMPRMLVTDGAVELRESADVLENEGKRTIVLRDLKHYAANEFERLVGSGDRFQTFISMLGRTRSSIQQTELGHFTPPPQKPKSRFMNLGPTLRWGEMVSWHLSQPHSTGRDGISAKRMNEKLGWVRDFRDDLAQWNRMQAIINESLTFINTQGIYRGAEVDLEDCLDELRADDWERCEPSESMARKLLDFVAEAGSHLAEGERGWLSTEIVESAFGIYKRMEGQHSKGGFTSLLAAFPALLGNCTPQKVRGAMARVRVKKLKDWTQEQLGSTLSSKRTKAYREAAPRGTVSLKPT